MRTVRVPSIVLAAVSASVAMLASAPARAAGDRQACMNAAEHAQSLRDGGKYVDARKQFLVCVRDTCPAFVKKDCTEWLAQLEIVTPTVVFGAKDGSRDLLDVSVSVDGNVVLQKLDGTPLPIDPGPHTFKFEWSGQSREEQVVINAGQKGRNVVATFGAAKLPAASSSDPGSAPAAAPSSAPPPEERPKRGSVVPALVVGGVGVLGLAGFVVFGIAGKSEKSDLEGSCKPRCSSDQVGGVRTKFIIADVSLGVGLVALGVSAYMLLKRPTVSVDRAPTKTGFRSVEVHLGPTHGGAAASLSASF